VKILRDPIRLTGLAEEMREHAGNVEHEAKEEGKECRAQPRLRRLRAAAREMDEAANRGGRLEALDAAG
jgi:hypothetical protein